MVRRENQYLITKIRAARTAGIKPTSLLLHRQPNTPWEPIDFALLEALQILDQEVCNGCGNPIWLCEYPERDVQMKAHRRVCRGQQAIRERQNALIKDSEKKKQDSKDRSEWGVQWYSKPELDPQSDFDELPTRRDAYAKIKELNG